MYKTSADMTDLQGQPQYGHVYSHEKGAGVPEQAFVTLWMFVIFLSLEQFGPIRYLCMLGLLVIFFFDRNRQFPLLVKCWPIFLLPILGFLSIGWSPYPADALKQSLMLFLTPFIAILIAGRLTPQQFMRAVMFAGMGATLWSVPYIDTLVLGGPYQSKNSFGMQMFIAMLMCLCAVLNADEHKLIRLMALPFIPICFVFQVLAESTTTYLVSAAAILALVGMKFVWIPSARVGGLRILIVLFGVAFAAVISLIFLSMPDNVYTMKFLDMLGKDSSLTGRTELWDVAAMVSERHPWLGVGLEGFWQYDTGLAQTMNEIQYREFGTKLGFHSSYWDVRVHLGWVGLGLFIAFLLWVFIRFAFFWVRDPSLINSTLLIFVCVSILISLTENYLWGPFWITTFLFILAGVTPFGRFQKQYVGRVRLN